MLSLSRQNISKATSIWSPFLPLIRQLFCFSIFCIDISLDVSVSLLIGRIKFRQTLSFKADWLLRCLSKDHYKHFFGYCRPRDEIDSQAVKA